MRRLLEQLRKRSVFKVAAAYAIVGWLAMQISDVMFPALGLPGWTITLTAALLIVGFPLALALAWTFDITPEGIRLDPGDDREIEDAQAAMIGKGAAPARTRSAAPPADSTVLPSEANTMAVLPFLDLSAGRDNEYFADGLTEELLNVLSGIDGLRVSSRTSCFTFKNKDVDIPAVAEKLKVAHILEGSVRKAGNRIRITAQLIEVSTDSHLWSDNYDREMEDIFAIQQDIAQKIVGALKLRLSLRDLPAVTSQSVIAYDHYLRGRSFLHKFAPKSLGFAIETFQRATEVDSQYARAWSGLAEAHSLRAIYYDTEPSDKDDADAASLRAVTLGPDLAEAHASRGLAFLATESYTEAEREFVTAIDLAPQTFEAYYYAGRSCVHQGQLRRALQFFEKAAAVAPEDYDVPLIAGPIYRSLGDEERAGECDRRGIELAERHLETNPDSARPYYLAATALMLNGQLDKALDWAKRAIAIDPSDRGTLYNVACFYAQAGRTEEALDCLEKAAISRSWLQNDPELDPLRRQPRFQALLRG